MARSLYFVSYGMVSFCHQQNPHILYFADEPKHPYDMQKKKAISVFLAENLQKKRKKNVIYSQVIHDIHNASHSLLNATA